MTARPKTKPTSYSWKFILTVALPLLLACTAVGTLTFDLIGRVSTGANLADQERTREIVRSALKAAQQQLANTVSDNSYWDDAVKGLYGEIDVEWARETWSVSSEAGVNYDMMIVVDRNEPSALVGYRRGPAFRPGISTYFDDKLEAMLDKLPDDGRTSESTASIIQTPDGPAIIAAAPIVPTSESLQIPSAKPRFLVFGKYLTRDHVTMIGEQYVISGLAILPLGSEAAKDVIAGPDGAAVASVAWVDRRPGDIEYGSVVRLAAIVLGFLALVTTGIGFRTWRLVGLIAKREAAATHDSRHDALTGLPNRVALMDDCSTLLAAPGSRVAAAFIDLDGFKDVNDTYDHETGDRLICAVAAGMSHLLDGRAAVYRLGGDEFVAVFHGADALRQTEEFAADLIRFLATPFDMDGKIGAVGASIGIASGGGGQFGAAELMRRADIAMYKAKGGGKNRYCVFKSDFDGERMANQLIAEELERIIRDDRMEIAYQPVVSAKTRQIVGVEALARWPANAAERVTPDRFIRVAETSGLIEKLGECILRKACRDAKAWPGIKLAINISPKQLRHPEFLPRSLEIIRSSGVAPGNIEFEITEGILVDDVPNAKKVFAGLRQAGIQIALDDFGIGFSSIGYLRQFEFDRIKIDRSIVAHIIGNLTEQRIVQGTVLMAAGMTAQVTAEGVENADQIDLLRLTGCSELQGYYFHKPMPAHSFSELLAPAAAISTA